MDKNYEGKYALFLFTTGGIYFMGASGNDSYKHWTEKEKDTYGDTILEVMQVEVCKHHRNELGEPEERRFPKHWEVPPLEQIMRTRSFVKKGARAVKSWHPKGTELAVTQSGTWRLRMEGDSPAGDYRIAEPIDDDGYLTVIIPSVSLEVSGDKP